MAKGLAKHMGVGVINNELTMPGKKESGKSGFLSSIRSPGNFNALYCFR
jgi:hypothetical protein